MRGTPFPLLVPAALAAAFLTLPLAGLLVRTPWPRVPAVLTAPGVADALRLSVLTASGATVACVVLGVPLAWVLARSALPGRRLVRAVVTVPMVLPPVVGGVALLLVLGRNGPIGRLLAAVGVTLPFTTPGVVVAQTFVAMPFLVVAVEGALRAADARLEQAAATLGASRWYALRHVTLPLVAPGIAAGALLSWARALGEFGATITFAGSLPGVTRTVPIEVYRSLDQGDADAAVVLSMVLLTASVLVLVALRGRWAATR
ncbi:MAG: ABC transporter permease [Actinomycetota bacterium]|nr:ABC transporter permease [Actinomycetota bacterium]